MSRAPAIPAIWLASRSPRRRLLLAEAGIDTRVISSDIDDGELLKPRRLSPRAWVLVLAFIKARQVLKQLQQRDSLTGDDLILGADTLCVVDDDIVGQPRDAADARAMLHRLRSRAHETMTGVCMLHPAPLHGELVFDAATVRIGELTDAQIERYVAPGDWRGKAGAYNLSERIEAGWPITCDGDPTTVMGLPMRRLAPRLRRFTHAAASHQSAVSDDAHWIRTG